MDSPGPTPGAARRSPITAVKQGEAATALSLVNGTTVVVARYLTAFARPGDEVEFNGSFSGESRTELRIVRVQPKELYQAQIGYVTQPRTDSRQARFLRAEVAVGGLGIRWIHILRAERWWDEDLQFEPFDNHQCYVHKKEWHDGDSHVIWIGVQNFTPDAIFNATSPPICYLWLECRAAEIADTLVAYVEQDSELKRLLATGTSGQKTRYLLQKKLRRWYPQELEEFASGAPLREIVDFMGQVYTAIKDYRLPREGRG
jgi:hypothetical protein